MTDDRQQRREKRLAGLAGVVFGLLSLAVIPLSPEIGAPIGSGLGELADYYVRHRRGFLVGNYLGLAAFLPGFVQLVIVASWIRRRDEADGFLSALVLTTGTFAYAVGAVVLVTFQVLPFLVEGDGRIGFVGLASLANVGFCLFLLTALPFVVAIGWATSRTRIFPAWFARMTFGAVVPALAVASLGALTTEPRWLAAGGVATGFGFAGFFGWTLVMAALSFRADPA